MTEIDITKSIDSIASIVRIASIASITRMPLLPVLPILPVLPVLPVQSIDNIDGKNQHLNITSMSVSSLITYLLINNVKARDPVGSKNEKYFNPEA